MTNYLLALPDSSANASANVSANVSATGDNPPKPDPLVPFKMKRLSESATKKPATIVNTAFNPIRKEKKDRNAKPRFTEVDKDSKDKQMENIARTLGELENESMTRQRSRKQTKGSRKTRIDEYLIQLHMGMDEYERLLQLDDKSMGTTQHSKGLSSQYTLKVNSEKHHITLHTMMKIMSVNEFNWLKSTRNMAKTCNFI